MISSLRVWGSKGSWQLAEGSRQLAVDSWQGEVGSGKWAVGSWQLAEGRGQGAGGSWLDYVGEASFGAAEGEGACDENRY